MISFNEKRNIMLCGAALCLCYPSIGYSMSLMTEAELSNMGGEGVFALEETVGTNNITFNKLSLNADIEANLNIRKLALGCGGTNNSIATGCDIDMDNVSLSGDAATANGRVDTSALLKNPYFEIAIKNAHTKATREFIGLRFGSEQAKGLLTIGSENSTTPNGINKISGYMKVQSYPDRNTLEGIAEAAPAYMDVTLPPNILRGGFYIKTLGLTVATATFDTNGGSGGFWVPGLTDLKFSVPAPVLEGSRLTQMTVNPQITLPDMILGFNNDDNSCGTFANRPCNIYGIPSVGFPSGPNTQSANQSLLGTQGGPGHVVTRSCTALGFIPCSVLGIQNNVSRFLVDMYGRFNGIKLNTSFIQPLGLMHKLSINSPMAISVQKEDVLWPNAPSNAKKGWWMSVKDPIYLGELIPAEKINMCEDNNNPDRCVFPQFAQQFSASLSDPNTMPSTADLATLLSGNGALGVATGIVQMKPINVTINGMKLTAQDFVPNCRNGATFC